MKALAQTLSGRRVTAALPLCLAACLAAVVLCSNPFMRLSFDIWEHLIRIASLHDEGAAFIFWPEDKAPSMSSWHWMWALSFRFLGINGLFVWAKVIHIFQCMLAAICMFFFCQTTLRLVLRKEKPPRPVVFLLAASSTLLWFVGNGTWSGLQQAWIMWYSVTYQGATIPLFWYILALTIRLFWDECLPRRRVIFYVGQIAALFPLMTVMHPSEGVYYLLCLMGLCVVWLDRIRRRPRRWWYCAGAITLALAALAFVTIRFQLVPLPELLRESMNPFVLLPRIAALGRTYAASGLNRFPNSFSEAAMISLATGAALILIALAAKRVGAKLDKRLLAALAILSFLFFLIPMQPHLAGLACLVTHQEIVWRFFFASPWFMFLPLALYLAMAPLWRQGMPRYAALAAANVAVVALLLAGSRYAMTQVTFQNARSIVRSFVPAAVGVQYTAADIERLRRLVEAAEQRSAGDRPRLFYVRYDLAPIVRGVFRKYVLAARRHQLPKSAFVERHLDGKYTLVDVPLPPDFPNIPGYP